MSAPLVEFSSVSKSFRSGFWMRPTRILERLDLAVESGHVYGLLGPNGAGKTTTIKLLVGLIAPDAGRITIDGHAAGERSARQSLGFLPENPYFYDYLTGEELLDFFARLAGLGQPERRERVAELLERVGLASVAGRQLRKYSKGMLQRVGLAQALVSRPRLLVLDEPMSGLDPVGRRDVRDIILAERARGATVLFSSHVLQDVELICDRVAILVDGRLRSVGSLEERLSGRIRHYELSVEGLEPGQLPESAIVISSEAGKLLVRAPDLTAAQAVLRRADEAHGRVLAMAPARETLETIFLEEIGAAANGAP